MTTIKDQYMNQAKTNVSSYSIKFLKDPDTHKALQDTLVQQAVTLLWREYKSYKGITIIPRTPQQMSLPAVASEAETMATPQQASSSYPRPEPPEPPITVPLVLNTTTTQTYSRP